MRPSTFPSSCVQMMKLTKIMLDIEISLKTGSYMPGGLTKVVWKTIPTWRTDGSAPKPVLTRFYLIFLCFPLIFGSEYQQHPGQIAKEIKGKTRKILLKQVLEPNHRSAKWELSSKPL